MSATPYDQQIEDLLKLYRTQREEAAETRRRINETTATATAPRQAVKVTVSAQGEVTAVEFPTAAYRRMAAKEFADVLLTTIQQARAQAFEEAGAVVSAQLPPGVAVADLLQGRLDPDAILPVDPEMPDHVRDYLDHGFRAGSHG
ncbi:YbaB/EbfC family nucleoid-associated protein [Streptomyces coerulescens]|uniref:YbaB/EbfC family nucleoid-associated protein n=1 Tax=Streptomyces coerulescens TaxID=29304 RepID=A0ABW0CUU3_STRCD